jgi:hypothetical protein
MSTFLSSYNFGQSKQIPDEPNFFLETGNQKPSRNSELETLFSD